MKLFLKAGTISRLNLAFIALGLALPVMGYAQAHTSTVKPDEVIKLTAADAKINLKTVDHITDNRLTNSKGTTLRSGVTAAINGERTEPDLVFHFKTAKAGKFVMQTLARTNEEGAKILKNAKTKFESLFIKIQIDENRATKRVVYVPWDVALQTSGKFNFTGKAQTLKIWLPRGINFDYVRLSTYSPPAIPEAAQNYVPKIVPPATRPRLWVNQESLPSVKAALTASENIAAWNEVRKVALVPFDFKVDPKVETQYNEPLELAAEKKAFYYLMTGEERVGREAIKLVDDYLANVEFGNILDITRELGRAIYTGSEVYDWCYKLMTPAQKQSIYKSLIRLADDMEIGWPPFLEPIVYGHGSEAQISRDLLSMSIALYDEDPIPYKYTSYTVLEQLVPMRKFQYEAGRNNQGVNYGAYRMGWDLHAATLMAKMTGKEVFDHNIKSVNNQFIYMRLPNGHMLRDGDGFNIAKKGQPFYWGPPLPLLMASAYAKDPILKYDFEKVGANTINPVLFLLLNDPNLKSIANRDKLPLTYAFGKNLGGMVARTGWNMTESSNDVVAEVKGGGYQFANHQQSDAGSIQLYYRGFQFGDIGQYKFYGTPYDLNFNKRSIAHSMMLTVDPNEKFGTLPSNDGGTRWMRVNPETPEQIINDPLFSNGKVISTDFGPSPLKPFYSYFAVDLKPAYSDKIEKYDRRFCFINMNRADIPAVIIISDQITSADASFKKCFQINSFNKPQIVDQQIVLNAKDGDKVGKTYINMISPAFADRKVETLSGAEAISSFGNKYTSPDTTQPEAHASRTLISPLKESKTDNFLTVFQVADGKATPLAVKHETTSVSDVLIFDNRVVSMPKGNQLINEAFEIEVPKGEKQYHIVLNGLADGDWNIKGAGIENNVKVLKDKNTIFFVAKPGTYKIKTGAISKLKYLDKDESLMPK